MPSARSGNDDSGFLDFDQTGAYSLFQLWENAIYSLAGFDKLDLDGQVVGDLQYVGRMDAMRGAKSGHALQYRCSSDAAVKEKVEQAGVDGNAVMFGPVAQVEGDLNCFA